MPRSGVDLTAVDGPRLSACSGGIRTLVSWGGAYTRSQILAFVRPWQERSDIRVDVDEYTGGLDSLRKQVQSLNFKWDVIDLEISDAIRGCEEGLLEPIDVEILAPYSDASGSAVSDFIPGSLTDCAVGTVVWSTVIAYDRRLTRIPRRVWNAPTCQPSATTSPMRCGSMPAGGRRTIIASTNDSRSGDGSLFVFHRNCRAERYD